MALTAEQYHEIQEILSERRFRAEKEALEKQREVLEKVSGYADLDEKLRTLSISAMEKAQEGDAGGEACAPGEGRLFPGGFGSALQLYSLSGQRYL